MIKKKLSILFAFVVASAIALFCVACNDKPTPVPTPGGGDDDDPEQYVTSITYSGEYKNMYYEGETFDPTGLTVIATWYDGEEEPLTVRDYEITPAVLTPAVTEVRLSYEDNYVEIPVTVKELAPTELFLADVPDQTVHRGAALSFDDMKVTAVMASGDKVALKPDYYDIKIDGQKFTGDTDPSLGLHTISVECKNASKSFDIAVVDGVVVEAENIISTDDIESTDRNFVEKTSDDYKYSAKNDSYSSGKGYLANGDNGDEILFHVWAEKSGKATLIMRVSCAGVEPGITESGEKDYSSPTGSWSIWFLRGTHPGGNTSGYINPPEVKTPSSTEFTPVNGDMNLRVTGGVAVKDGEFVPGGDTKVFANWYDMPFAEYDLEQGDNVIKVHLNGKINIDRFEIRYIPDDHVHGDGRGMIHKEAFAAGCNHYGEQERYICAVCAQMFSDANGENRIYDAQIAFDSSAHKWEYQVVSYKKDYSEYEQFDLDSLVITGKCSVCGAEDKDLLVTIVNGNMTENTTSVTIRVGGQEMDLPVNVSPFTVSSLEILTKPNQTQYFGSSLDFSGLSVQANGSGKNIVLDSSAYTLKIDGAVVTDATRPECGIHTVTVDYKNKTAEFKIAVVKSLFSEGENVYANGSVPSDAKNYTVDFDNDSSTAEVNENAHGGQYLKGMQANKKYQIHIYAEEQQEVELILHVARDQMGGFGSNGPTNTWDVDLFSWCDFNNSNGIKQSLTESNTIKISGVVSRNPDGTFNPDGDPDLWTKWQLINIGKVTLLQGDNYIEFRVGRQMSLDCLEARYVLDHTHEADIMYHDEGCPATSASSYGILEHYDCAVCAKKYSDANGNNELKCISYQYQTPAMLAAQKTDPIGSDGDNASYRILSDVIVENDCNRKEK